MKRSNLSAGLILVLLLTTMTWGSFWYYVPTPNNLPEVAGSALTYGKKPSETYGKLFLLCRGPQQNTYAFYRADAYLSAYPNMQLSWAPLASPPAYITPRADAAISYSYSGASGEEKVLAIFGGRKDVWAYDVPTNTWNLDRTIDGTDSIGPGGSMEFGGFGTWSNTSVTFHYIIKGGGSYEFYRYNRPDAAPTRGEQPNMPFPYWTRFPSFQNGGNPPEPFSAGADLAIYPSDPYVLPAPDQIYAIRGTGVPFAMYQISTGTWSHKDNILGSGAGAGGALVSHPYWHPYGPPEEENTSIMHCFRGDYDNLFDDYDYPSLQWLGAPPNPETTSPVAFGSDLVFGHVWYRYNGQMYDQHCIWASFGNSNQTVGLYVPDRLPTLDGGQSSPTGSALGRDMLAQPNPACGPVSFRLPSSDRGSILICSKEGRIVSRLSVDDGSCAWDLRDAYGVPVPSGVYYYVLDTGRERRTGQVLVSR